MFAKRPLHHLAKTRHEKSVWSGRSNCFKLDAVTQAQHLNQERAQVGFNSHVVAGGGPPQFSRQAGKGCGDYRRIGARNPGLASEYTFQLRLARGKSPQKRVRKGENSPLSVGQPSKGVDATCGNDQDARRLAAKLSPVDIGHPAAHANEKNMVEIAMGVRTNNPVCRPAPIIQHFQVHEASASRARLFSIQKKLGDRAGHTHSSQL